DPEMIADWLRPGLPSPNPSLPSPLAGEGGPRSSPDGGAVSNAQTAKAGADTPHPPRSASHLPPQGGKGDVVIVKGDPGAPPVVDVLVSEGKVPWAGHTGRHAIPEVYDALRRSGMSLIF